MKNEYQCTRVVYKNQIYYREVFSDKTISWSDKSYINGDRKADLENEYQKTLIPTKTLNPSEEKGSIVLTEKEIETLRLCYVYSNMRTGHDVMENLFERIKANGEKPEVVNPVGQINLTAQELKIVQNALESLMEKGYYLNAENTVIMRKIEQLNNKPRETDKGEQNLCECCKLRQATTAKNMCNKCSQYW